MKVFVITTGCKHRIKLINEMLIGVPFEFIYSLSLRELSLIRSKRKRESAKFRQKILSAGEIGCFESHVRAWVKVRSLGEPSLILEDNIKPLRSIREFLEKKALKETKGHGLISFADYRLIRNTRIPYKASLIQGMKPMGSKCYGLTSERACNLLSRFKKFGYIAPVDNWLSNHNVCGVYTYVSNKPLVKRSAVTSSANKSKGEKSFNLYYMLMRIINRIKYGKV